MAIYSGVGPLTTPDPGLARDDAAAGQPPLRRYLDTIRARWWIVALAVVLCTGAAAVYVLTAAKVYEAHADMLVTPVPDDQTAVLGLGLIRRSTDPTRDVTTAARMVANSAVAARVERDLRSSAAPDELLRHISADPVAQSSIVAITASAPSPERAARLADAFARAAVEERTEDLHRVLDPAIARLEGQIAEVTGGRAEDTPTAATQPLYEELAALLALRSAPDPTLRVQTRAQRPGGPSSPRTKLSIAGGLVAGLLLGIAGAFGLEALDPRRTREDRIAALGLPILTRVPHLARSRRARDAFDESFRFLRTMLRFAPSEVSSIAVTSTAEKEGKTTTSFQLAMAALEARQRVVVVDADAYRPGLLALVAPDWIDRRTPGLLDYLAGEADLDDVIHDTDVPGLRFVPPGTLRGDSVTGLLEQERGRAFAGELARTADLVILDCPPVGPRADAVLVAAGASGVILVTDLKRVSETAVTSTVARLRSAGANLLGVVVNHDAATSATYDYKPVTERGRRRRRARPRVRRPRS